LPFGLGFIAGGLIMTGPCLSFLINLLASRFMPFFDVLPSGFHTLSFVCPHAFFLSPLLLACSFSEITSRFTSSFPLQIHHTPPFPKDSKLHKKSPKSHFDQIDFSGHEARNTTIPDQFKSHYPDKIASNLPNPEFPFSNGPNAQTLTKAEYLQFLFDFAR
jgi:hypothetical protein